MAEGNSSYILPEYSAILSFVDAVFVELNMGLFVYHVEDPTAPSSLRLIYANREASRCTGADMQPLVGRRILEAFPQLATTDIPRTYLEVATQQQSRRVGVVQYQDDNLPPARYRVKAFPMPSDCVGILFERVHGDAP